MRTATISGCSRDFATRSSQSIGLTCQRPHSPRLAAFLTLLSSASSGREEQRDMPKVVDESSAATYIQSAKRGK